MIPELIGGAVVSIVVELVKRYTKQDKLATMMTLLLISVVGAVLYAWLSTAGYWETLVSLLITASGIYALLTGTSRAFK